MADEPNDVHALLANRRLYLCTPDRADLTSFVAACIEGGVDVVQLRDKTLEARALLARGVELARVCREHGVAFLMNDRPDLALEVGADGVHVGQDDVPPALARRILGPVAIVGLSTHSTADLHAARHEPVDYLSAGPVVPTPTKPGRPGTGLAYVSHVAALLGDTLPWFVTGGVSLASIGELVAAGARRFVAVRWLTEASDPARRARELREAIDEAVGVTG